ncbi:MAG: hypothetical protein Q4B17_00430 [Lautropia sp.]|nr:hypothetical protein [Lautropia sp.]
MPFTPRVLAQGLCAAWMLLTTSAHGMLTEARYEIHSDGSPGWDGNDGPGMDSGPNNRIVRTHDYVDYLVSLSSGDQGAKAPRIELTLPKRQPGQQPIAVWNGVPNQCTGAGSAVLDGGQRLVCVLPDYPASRSDSVYFRANILGSTPNGTLMPAPAIRISTTAVANFPPQGHPPAVTVSAAPFYDVVLLTEHPPSAYQPLGGPANQPNIFFRPMVGVMARHPHGHGRKGIEQLDPTQPIHIDLDLSSFVPSVGLVNWVPPHGRQHSFADGCGNSRQGQPHPRLFGPGISNYGKILDHGPNGIPANATERERNASVLNGGDCQVLASDRNHISLALHGVDTTLAHTPSNYHLTGKVPASDQWVAAKVLVLWTDVNDYPLRQEVFPELIVTRFEGRSISQQPIIGDRPDNNRVKNRALVDADGTSSKIFTYDGTLPRPYGTTPDALANTGRVDYMAPQQSAGAAIRYTNTGAIPHQGIMLCDILDRTAFDLAPHFNARVNISAKSKPDPVATLQYGAHRTGAPYFSSTDSAPSPDGHVGTGQSAYATASCNDTNISWFDTPQQAEAAGGLVYVRASIDTLRGGENANLMLQGLVLRETWAATIHVETPRPGIRRAGEPITAGTIIRNRADIGTTNGIDVSKAQNQDHLEVVGMKTVSRIEKTVTKPANALTSPVAAGTTVSFELRPRYSTTFPPSPRTVTVTDILPPRVSYVVGSARMGAQVADPLIQPDTPAAGMTTLTWRYENLLPHAGHNIDPEAALPPITYDARLSLSLKDGNVVRNNVRISGGPSDYERDCSFNLKQQSHGTCVKAASVQISVQSPPGFQLEKTAEPPEIQPGDPFSYTLSFVSMGKEVRAPDIADIIDILPFLGDGSGAPDRHRSAREPGSVFTPGGYWLASVEPPAIDPQARIYYTKRPHAEINNDPGHPSNRIPDGETRWCLASAFGTAGCPAHIGETTAIRTSPAIDVLPANTPYSVKLSLLTHTVLAQPGNIFANRAGAGPADAGSSLLYVESQSNLQVRILKGAASSLSGRTFVDFNQNGQWDAEDQPLPGQCIVLRGSRHQADDVLASVRADADGHFSFSPGQKNRIHATADCSGTPLPSFGGLLAGEYSLARAALTPGHLAGASFAGSAGGTARDGSITAITLASGVQATDYRLTELPSIPTLTLTSTLTNDHGGTATTADLLLRATAGGTEQPIAQGTSGTPAVTRVAMPVGPIQLGAPGLPGYRAGTWQCTVNGQPVAAVPGTGATRGAGTAAPGTTGATPAPHVLTLRHGDKAVCSIHYDDEPARLTLTSTVTNSNGRTATPQDFVLHASGPATLKGVTGEAAITGAEVPPGTYTLREDELPNYVAGAWRCDAGTLDGNRLTLTNGEHATCSINNTDQPVSLTLVLDVLNEHGGTATRQDTAVSAQGPDSINGISGTKPVTVAPVRPGVYQLAEPQLPGYRTGKWICSAGTLTGNTLTLGEHQNVTCRIVLKDLPAELKVTKTVVGSVKPIPNSDTDYQLQYRISVQHQSGAAGLYSLIDMPAFDPDVKILGTQILKNARLLSHQPADDGSWVLASEARLPIGAEDVYLMDFRIRVPYGSNTANNRCTSGAAAQGKGLFNQLSLRNLSAETTEAAPITSQACIDTPVPISTASLSIEKTSTSRSAEVGDLIHYRLRIRNHGTGAAISPVVVDRLPAGFRLEAGTVRVQNARVSWIRQNGMRELHIKLDRIEAPGTQGGGNGLTPAHQADNGDVIITYRVRLGVGAQEGDGTNRVHVECLTPNGGGTAKCSNESRWKVQVRAGIFSEEACVAGQVFVDCNGNALKDAEELGIPGVRLYLQNGTWFVTDAHGKYSHCGLRPRTHVLKIDGRTLPRRSRLVTSSAQSAGDAQSLFIDAKKGMLHRADFIEGSCSNTVIEQVKARQAQGENTSVQTETGQPALSFESKRGVPARPLHQGTDAARQPIGRTRY